MAVKGKNRKDREDRKDYLDEFKQRFQKYLNMPVPESFLQGRELFPVFQDGLLLGSQLAIEKQYLAQGHIYKFLQLCPENYYLIGFWGHGVNSYAFYYSRVDDWSKILFRLPYGGLYMDNLKMAEQIREFLIAFLAFEQSIIGKVDQFIAIDSMGAGQYNIEYPDGTVIQSRGSLFRQPDFGKLLQA
jgi:hypothetical protein